MSAQSYPAYALAIHGGAGTITREELSAEKEAAVRQGLSAALQAGETILKNGGTALESVEAAVRSLEDNPLFNAGKGSVLSFEGNCRMDAAVMDGQSLRAGAVGCVGGIKNPVSLARLVMEQSDYVLLCSEGAQNFAQQHGVERLPEAYFITEEKEEEWQKKQAAHRKDQRAAGFGTVGAVALDSQGNLAAATSTGGLTNKQFNRLGDTPIIGSGTYANNQTCAVSCTGDGEFIIRAVSAYDVSCLLEYKGLSLPEACEVVIHQKLKAIQGEGGLIAIDRLGHVAMPYNSPSMYRGSVRAGEKASIAIFES